MAAKLAADSSDRPRAGYDVNFEKIFNRKRPDPLSLTEVESYRCFICKLLLRQPQQLSCCGRRSCRVCIDGLRSRYGKVFHCPNCGEKIGDGSTDNMEYPFPDQSCVNDMKTFYTVCNTKPVPCGWKGLLLELEKHYTECGNLEVHCTLFCGATMLRSKLPQHLKTDCLLRNIGCQFCLQQVQVAMLQEHLLECENRKDSSCPFCKASCESKQQLNEHVYGGRCTKALLSCPLREALNCRTKVKPSQLVQHSVLHVKDILHKNQQDSTHFQKELIEVHSELKSMREMYEQQKELIRQYENSMAILKQQINEVTSRHSEQIDNLTENVSRISSGPAAKPYGVHSSDVAHFEGNIRSLQNSFDVLARQIDAINLKVEENTETVGTLQTEMNQCTKAITQVNGMVNEVGLKVDILAVRSINGILIWKVNEVEKRIEEAKTGKILSLYSPPFFTSLHGYRMCLRLYLDGDGQGKGTHVSLFLVIMKSDYDDLLTWPFKQKVTLYLLNQQDPYNTKAHIAQAFRPTETSTSFQKPRGPFNTASGFPKFAPVEKLRDRNFVQDDCMYFKVKIDMTDVKAPDYPAY